MIIYVSNTNMIELYGLRGAVDNEFVNDATVTLTIKSLAGTIVDGPLDMVPTNESPPKGNYRAIVDHDLDLLPNTSYMAVIDVDAGPNRIGHWEMKFRPTTRER
jgi:hypothetical protein